MIDKDVLIREAQRLSTPKELGRPPFCWEFEKFTPYSRHQIRNRFGNYTLFLQAAGLLEAATQAKRGAAKDFFRADVQNVLDSYHHKQLKGEQHRVDGEFERLVFCSDPHFPFCSIPAINAFYDFIEWFKPQFLGVLGDVYDMFAHSKFPKSRNIYTPVDEHGIGRRLAEDFFKECRKRIGRRAKIIVIPGNHDIRPLLELLRAAPALESFLDEGLEKHFEFPSVETVVDDKTEVIVSTKSCGDVLAHHGYSLVKGKHRDDALMPVYVGHTHLLGIDARNARSTLFEASCGYLGDPFAKALMYRPMKITRWINGCCAQDRWGPRPVFL